MRGVAWWTGSVWLDCLSMIPAAMVPLGALIVTEGMLRRHAPRVVKIAVAASAAIVLGLGGVLGLERFTTPYYIAAGAVPTGRLCDLRLAAGVAGPLHTDGIGKPQHRPLAVGAHRSSFPSSLTDFQALAPDIPVRLGALGALLVVTAVLIAGGGAETRRQGILMTALRLSSSALLGAAAACVSPDVDAAQIMRFAAIAISGVLTIGLMVDALRAHFESQVPGVLNSVAASPARTRDALIAELERHPIFESARRRRESELAA